MPKFTYTPGRQLYVYPVLTNAERAEVVSCVLAYTDDQGLSRVDLALSVAGAIEMATMQAMARRFKKERD